MKIIHIGYGDSAAGCIKEAINNHNLEGDEVIPSRDDFTQGPISECDVTMQTDQRPIYWKVIDALIDFGIDIDDFYQESIAMLNAVDNAEIVIWQGDSCHDILASAWLMTYFKNKNLKWSIIDLARLSPESLNDGLPPVNIAMFSPEQITELYRFKQSVPLESLSIYQDLWTIMRQQNGAYRIKNNNEITSVDEFYHDDFILSQIPNEWTKTPKVIGKIMSNSEHRLSDTTVEWRIRQLINSDKIKYTGILTGIDDFSIKRS